jgi:hypothetical protein
MLDNNVPGQGRITVAGDKGYDISQRVRKRIEEVFGWIKTVGTFRKTRYIGLEEGPHERSLALVFFGDKRHQAMMDPMRSPRRRRCSRAWRLSWRQ